ncbi:MAG: BolA family transcriptional regulator [Alphaproteobacteria bacterium]|nr:BolA family transcriptional regulator [Alphaproteobacteria bacterium]
MAMKAEDIVRLIQDALPNAQIKIQDTMGDQDHYMIEVGSKAFQGKTKVQQHQMVYQALGGRMGCELHALSVKTYPSQDHQVEK